MLHQKSSCYIVLALLFSIVAYNKQTRKKSPCSKPASNACKRCRNAAQRYKLVQLMLILSYETIWSYDLAVRPCCKKGTDADLAAHPQRICAERAQPCRSSCRRQKCKQQKPRFLFQCRVGKQLHKQRPVSQPIEHRKQKDQNRPQCGNRNRRVAAAASVRYSTPKRLAAVCASAAANRPRQLCR